MPDAKNKIALARWRIAQAASSFLVILIVVFTGRDVNTPISVMLNVNGSIVNKVGTVYNVRASLALSMAITFMCSVAQLIECKDIVTSSRAVLIRKLDWLIVSPVMWTSMGVISGMRDAWILCFVGTLSVCTVAFSFMTETVLWSIPKAISFGFALFLTIIQSCSVLWFLMNEGLPDYMHAVVALHIMTAIAFPMIGGCAFVLPWPSDQVERIYAIASLIGRHFLVVCASAATRHYIDSK